MRSISVRPSATSPARTRLADARRSVRLVLPPGVLLDVHYEDVVADFEPQAQRIIAHCGLEWDDHCLRFYENDRLVRTASKFQVRQPIFTDSIGRWKRYQRHLGPLIEALGPYGPAGG